MLTMNREAAFRQSLNHGLCALLPLVMLLGGRAIAAEPMVQYRFERDTQGWTAHGNAELSASGRIPDHHSLSIAQWDDADRDSHWLSPLVQSPGEPVIISFWAADNYQRCNDYTYAATLDALDYNADGKHTGGSNALKRITWDPSAKSDMWGIALPQGLVWTYHEVIYRPKGQTFRLKFHWPKPLTRGECHITDIRISPATQAQINQHGRASRQASAPSDKLDRSVKLEISTPVVGNLFYQQTPLRFEILAYGQDGSTLPTGIKKGRLRYQITDFEHLPIATGSADFSGADRFADEAFLNARHRVGEKRKYNLHSHFIVDEAAAHKPGRLMFIRVELIDADDHLLAADTVPFGVVSRHEILDKQLDDARFAIGYFDERWTLNDPAYVDDSIAEKLGVAWYQVYDYHWKRRQPALDTEPAFGESMPRRPRIVFCPNMEQCRGNDREIRTFVPEEAIIDDPLHPGQLTFKIDEYINYMLAYIRHHRAAIAAVVPSGMERVVDARTIELHKKAYAAIKAEFPDLPVGFMIYSLFQNPSAEVNLFVEHELFRYADFINTHMYASSANWSEWKRLQGIYRNMGLPVPPLTSTEYVVVGGPNQVTRSRNMIVGHLDAFKHGMTRMNYYNTLNPVDMLADPFLRDPTDMGGDMNSGFLFLQRVDRAQVSELINFKQKVRRWWIGGWGGSNNADSVAPLLSTMVYHNLVRNFDRSTHRETMRPTRDTVVEVFERAAGTVAAIWSTDNSRNQTVIVHSESPFTVQDLFGRTTAITPYNGRALITADEHPLTLIFDRTVKSLRVEPVELRTDEIRVSGEGQTVFRFTAPTHFEMPATWSISATVDGTWPETSPRKIDKTTTGWPIVELPLRVTEEHEVGAYPLRVRLYGDQGQFGYLHTPLRILPPLRVSLAGKPMTADASPGLVVTLSNTADVSARGVVRFEDRHFSPSVLPQEHVREYELAAGTTRHVHIPLDRDLVKLAPTYDLSVEVEQADGRNFQVREDIHFRAAPKAESGIHVDGDLADWDLESMQGVPLARQFATGGKSYGGPDDIDGKLYVRWDDHWLYFAAIINDDSTVQRFSDIDMWQDDNIMFGLYPWGWRKGEPVRSGFYREHLGLCADGESRIFRLGSVPGGPDDADDARIAVTRDSDRYIYEWAYPAAALHPLQLQKSANFRISMFAFDRDRAAHSTEVSRLGGLQLGGFLSNVNSRPRKWCEFVLVE